MSKLDFQIIKKAVNDQLDKMCESGILWTSNVNKYDLWDTYINSFPEGTNPIFRERTEHDCNCCKSFIRNIGGVVGYVDGLIVSIWDVEVDDPNWQVVADAMSSFVKKHSIFNLYLNDCTKVGTDRNTEHETGLVWDHFYYVLPEKFVKRASDIASFVGNVKSNVGVFKRSLEEITKDSVDTVMDLINQKSLYRGDEMKHIVRNLQKWQNEYFMKNDETKVFFLWDTALKKGDAVKVKNTSIGTLLSDLSEGMDLESAVKSYESKVAPTNYKRTTALITPAMISKAEKTVVSLGLENALQRRYAVPEDVSVNNVLFADRTTQSQMKDSGVFGDLKPTKPSNLKLDKVEEISAEDFINNVLPRVQSVELLFENNHIKNLMSLIAPVDNTAGNMLKWDNNFSWSYKGDITDSIKEHVKAAGGSVTGDIRFSIKWNDEHSCTSDLDAHCDMPTGRTIYFSNKRDDKSGGNLDVDIMHPRGVAVENITFPSRNKMRDGLYKFKVHNYSKGFGRSCFTAQIEFDGQIFDFEYDKNLRDGEKVTVATVELKNGQFRIIDSIPHSQSSRNEWGVDTKQFHKVNMIMNSPNHWDGQQTGNKHLFFIVDGCTNDSDCRGFYNEFLRDELYEHRKVFEVLSGKMKVPFSERQLSGLGFSSTQREDVIVKVSGSFNRMLKIKF